MSRELTILNETFVRAQSAAGQLRRLAEERPLLFDVTRDPPRLKRL